MDKWLSRSGTIISALYLIFLAFVLKDSWVDFFWLSLNEQGDFLAGAFGPLAFLWLVLGFFQQRIELRQNTQALEYQATELKNSVEQQMKMVQISRKQLETEIEQIQEAQRKRQHQIAPQLKLINFMEGASFDEDQEYIVEIQNFGGSAFSVWMSSDTEKLTVNYNDYPRIDLKDSFEFHFSHPIQHIQDSDVEICFNYSDVDGNNLSESYNLLIRKENRILSTNSEG